MSNSLLERLQRFSGQVPKPDACAQVAVSQLLQEKTDLETPPATPSSEPDASVNVPDGDIQELLSKVRGHGPVGTPPVRMRQMEHSNQENKG
jgi:hypothetical protein